ncbi:competence type IV pilus minor pilin ComGG [Bacillus sp. N1-1]|jgi:hypothetical protein|uniref:competence type IV pilus minor pilin ComGG n=1 Tax=Bacillus sp. N1-1 TaxID=2682541 RepID=UPI001319A3E2|nr:competence type IV pilus minor pilin ComGG [Bacillus sp. N1-1]QHA92542.1 hypothetical protein GNK04_14510 [Bacillus sp. N1-1]
MEKKRNKLVFKCLKQLDEQGYMTAMMMLISTLLLGFIFHLCHATMNERAFLDREEEQFKKHSLLVLGMKDTISYIQKTDVETTEKTFTYEEGTVHAAIQSSPSEVIYITLNGTTQNETKVFAMFQYNQTLKEVLEWSEG